MAKKLYNVPKEGITKPYVVVYAAHDGGDWFVAEFDNADEAIEVAKKCEGVYSKVLHVEKAKSQKKK